MSTKNETEQTPKKPASLAKTLLMLVVGMSAYVYLRLSTSRLVFPGLLVALSILEEGGEWCEEPFSRLVSAVIDKKCYWHPRAP